MLVKFVRNFYTSDGHLIDHYDGPVEMPDDFILPRGAVNLTPKKSSKKQAELFDDEDDIVVETTKPSVKSKS